MWIQILYVDSDVDSDMDSDVEPPGGLPYALRRSARPRGRQHVTCSMFLALAGTRQRCKPGPPAIIAALTPRMDPSVRHERIAGGRVIPRCLSFVMWTSEAVRGWGTGTRGASSVRVPAALHPHT
jgi:hypothetical protein